MIIWAVRVATPFVLLFILFMLQILKGNVINNFCFYLFFTGCGDIIDMLILCKCKVYSIMI